jgi:hypothetical protein
MLLQPDSKLYIMPADGGEPRLMNCNTGNMNSWHSWSPNGRWLVFSTKERGPYTQLYLTHIDKNGNDSPPVFLENLAFESRAANIPEFLPVNASVLNKMEDDFSNHAMYYTRLAGTSVYERKYLDALKYVETALNADSTYLDAYIERISIRLILGNIGSTDDLRDRKIARARINSELGDREGFSRDMRTTYAILKEISQTRDLNQEEQNILSSISE